MIYGEIWYIIDAVKYRKKEGGRVRADSDMHAYPLEVEALYSFLTRKLFENRGYDEAFLRDMEAYDGGARLMNVDRMCECLRWMYENGKQVTFIGDFDMDGIMSSVVGYAGLKELGFMVNLFVPNPGKGYGFDETDIKNLLSTYPETYAIMTADVGVRCFEGVDAARKEGLRVLVTDHHMTKTVVPGQEAKSDVDEDGEYVLRPKAGEGQELLPDADCIVDPMQANDPFAFPYICGANVVYQVLQAYADTYCSQSMSVQIQRLRVFAGIGTISDSMPLVHENRHLVRDAVAIARLVYSGGPDFAEKAMSGTVTYRRAFRGLYALLKLLADVGKIKKPTDIDESLFGFYVAPMFNAVKRLDGDMLTVYNVFFSSDVTRSLYKLYNLNERRKSLVQEHMSKLEESVQPYAPYIYFSDAQDGILGLLATRLLDDAFGPCLVIRQKDNGPGFKGSGRSPDWYPFLDQTVQAGIWAAGHNYAFGVGFRNMKEVEAAYEFLRNDAPAVLATAGVEPAKPDFVISDDGTGDVLIDVMAFMEFLSDMDELRPFGKDFPVPDILLKFRPEDGEWEAIGSLKQHMKITLAHGFVVLCWNQADQMDAMKKKDEVSVRGRLNINEFGKRTTVQFMGVMT